MCISNKTGFSLVEVLVSMVVLAFGVIGAAGMQLAALRTTQQAAFQTFSLQLAAEIADAISVSERQVGNNWKVNPFEGMTYRAADNSELAVPSRLCYETTCDGQEFAEFEIYEWKKRIKAALPGGRILICRDAETWSRAVNALSWDCDSSSAANAPLVIKLGWQAKNPDGSLSRDERNQFPPSVAIAVSSRLK